MIYWEIGKPQIWDDMIKERTRLIKEKRAAEQAMEEAKQKHKEKMAQMGMMALGFLGGSVIIFAFVMAGIGIYGASEERRVYEEKIAKIAAMRIQRHQAEERRKKEEALEASK
jgi:hypothetical protein